MDFSWVYDHSAVDWEELSALYRIAPLGEKSPQDLATVLGFYKMKTAMAIFRNSKQAIESGVISET